MLKRSPTLTEQVKALIKRRILNNKFDAGRIPSEIELATALGVSRTTIRDALSRLEREGTIYRKQGAGTFVNMASLQIKTRLEEIWSYEAMLEAHDYTPSTQIISVAEQPLEEQTAAELQLPPTEPGLLVKKLFLADAEPVIFTLNHIPSRFIREPYPAADIFHQPIYQFLSDYCHLHLSYYVSEIVPLSAPDWLADILRLKPQTALISFDEIGYDQDNTPILKARSYFKDELLRLRLMRRE
jgi:GntR family transcriptional regulator